MLVSPSFLVPALLLLVAPYSDAKVYKRHAPLATETWSKRDVAADEAPHTFAISLNGEFLHQLEGKMTDISKSRSAWLNRGDLGYYLRPSEQAKRRVEDFLSSGGVLKEDMSYSLHEDVITVQSNVGTVARLFNTRMHEYQHLPTGDIMTRALHHELPDHLDEHIIHVRGVSDFVKPHSRRAPADFQGGFKMKKAVSTSSKACTASATPRSTTSKGKTSSSTRRSTSSTKRTTSSTKRTTSSTKRTTSSTKRTTSSTKRTTTSSKATTSSSAQVSSSSTALTTTTTATDASKTLKTFYATDLSRPTASSNPGEFPPGCLNTNSSFACINRMYGTDTYTPTKDIESVAVVAYGVWQNDSVLSFNSLHQPKAPAGYLPNRAYLGDPTGAWEANITQDDGEAVLDIECLLGVGYGLNVTAYASSVDYIGTVEALIALPDEDRPAVISMSYGVQENDVTIEYSRELCRQAQILTSLGSVFLVASGDNGVSVNNSTMCPPFATDMMSSCPYVVGVGGTANFNPERAGYEPSLPDQYNGWSSGGFSNYHPTPDYQKEAVAAYLKTIDTTSSANFNVSGRGWPDVSAYGQAIPIVQKDDQGIHMWLSGGTSASSPIFAGVLGLVSAKCKEAGKARLGWIHPTLYAAAVGNNGLHDITKGGSYWCGSYENTLGFPCETGFDPATGLGSPHFQKLVEVFGCA